jgi:uracil-DNA glycosylase
LSKRYAKRSWPWIAAEAAPLNAAAQQALLQAMTTDRDALTKSSAARALLAFYQEAGVDALLGEAPIDRFAAEPPKDAPAATGEVVRPQAERRVETPPRTVVAADLDRNGRMAVAPPASDAAVMAAREAAKGAASLEELRAILERFEGCALRNTASRLVFADGNPQARVMFVGEAPGRDEDIEGLPFVGRSGKLLDRMLAAIGLDRTSVYIANIVPWRPPGNRTPTPQESAICLPFIARQIELCNPDLLVTMGQPATQTLLDTKDGITRTRGRSLAYRGGTREIRAIPTFHPAYLLRQPLQKRLAWRDFLAIKKALASK